MDNILIREFAKITNDTQSIDEVVTAYGTIQKEGDTYSVLLDGSTEASPVELTMDADDGDRVTVSIKDHKITVTGNLDKPAQSLQSEAAQQTIQTKVEEAISGIGVGLKVYYAPELPTGVTFNKDDTWYKTNADDDTQLDALYVYDGKEWVQQEFAGGILREDTITAREIDVDNLCTNIAYIGPTDGRHVRVNSDGIHMFVSGDVEDTNEIAHFGYGEGTSKTGTSVAPYYNLGIRLKDSTIGNYSVAEGMRSSANNWCSHAEGVLTTASGDSSHAEGDSTTASGFCSHAEGAYTTSSDSFSHAEGYRTTASGFCSHASGQGTISDNDSMTSIGKYNTIGSLKAFAIGNGTDNDNRSDAFTVDWSGNVVSAGTITANGHDTPIGTLITGTVEKTSIGANGKIATVTITKGSYILSGRTTFASNATGYRGIQISKVSSASGTLPNQKVQAVSGSSTALTYTIPIVIEGESETYNLFAYQSSGSTLNLSYTALWAMRIS